MTDTAAGARASRAGREGRALLAALTFLTRLPLGGVVALDGDDVARAGLAFPLVGAALGAAVGATADALARPLSPLLAAGLALALGTLLTGALHLDALADSADALGAGPRALEVMREHALGAYGAVAVAVDLLVKVAALAALAGRGDALRFAVAAGALSRAAPVVLACSLPYARAGAGAGAALTRGGWPRALLAALLAVAIAVVAAGAHGLELAAAVAALVCCAAAGLRAWLGGVTGDTLGATTELAELLVLVLAVALAGAR